MSNYYGGGRDSRDNSSVPLINSSLLNNRVIKHTCSDDDDINLSKKRFKRSFVDSNMESVLLQCSGDVLTVLRGNPDSDHAAKKRDDTHIPIAF